MKAKLIVLLFLLFFRSVNLFAQEIEWQNTIGGDVVDMLYCISPTNDGGIILGGSSNSSASGDKTENSIGLFDYWIVKLDATGNILWQNTIGGTDYEYLIDISQTLDGGYILGGTSASDISGDKTENSKGDDDYWVVKLDASGNIQWDKTIGGNGKDYLNSISQLSDGGYIVGGTSVSDISGDKTENSMGGNDFWVMKLDSSGSIEWQNTIGGDDDDMETLIQQTFDGGYVMGGWSRSNNSGDKTENSQGVYDYWVIKVDSSGNIQWQNTIGGNTYDLLTSITQVSDGGYMIGGHSSSVLSGDKTENSQGFYDYWVIKLDSVGDIQWQNSIGGSDLDQLASISTTSDGGFIIGGYSDSNVSGDKTENSMGSYDYWIIKLDSLGVIQWQNTIGGNNEDYLRSLITTPDGIILGGNSNSVISGDKAENTSGGHDYWVVKLTGYFNLIQGVNYADLNSNNVLDVTEPFIANTKTIESNTGRLAFSDNNGFYTLYLIDSGNFQVAPFASINYYTASPANYNINFSSINQIDSLNDFSFQPTGNFDDVCVNITPMGNFRSGFNASYLINYSNQGTTTINGTVVFYPDSNISFVSSIPTATSITPDSIIFSVGNLTPFQIGQILVRVNVNQGLPIGTLINSGAMILPIIGDVNPGCNQSYWEVVTTGSFDPNDILVNRNFLYDYEIPNEPQLEYIIRFQNTGNDTAFTIKILNPIDTARLQLNTLEIVAASHPMNASWIPWERNMQFLFDNVLLPDSNTNESLSHGFIRYKIKPKTNLLVGDSLNNQAYIYFDFNNPVATNIAKTDIILFTGVQEPENSFELFNIYPNPATSKLTIQFNSDSQKNISLELFDVCGQRIKFIHEGIISSSGLIKTIDISDLSSGIYFIKAGGENITVKRFVKY